MASVSVVALLAHEAFGDHLDDLRDIDERRGELGVGGLLDPEVVRRAGSRRALP
jgi:hypothetical protein